MNAADFIPFGVGAAVLVAMLVFSPRARHILKMSLTHPFAHRG